MDWSRVADWSATALAVIGLGARQQYMKGKNAQRFKEFQEKLKAMKDQIDRHESRLTEGGEAFARIDEKLSSMKESIARIEAASQRTQDLIIEHMADGGKSAR